MNNIFIFEKLSNKLSMPNLMQHEIDCKCNSALCKFTYIAESVLYSYHSVRTLYNAPIKVLSGFRCLNHNAEEGGKLLSKHLLGHALDVTGHDLVMLESLCRSYFDVVIPYPNNGFLHVNNNPNFNFDFLYI